MDQETKLQILHEAVTAAGRNTGFHKEFVTAVREDFNLFVSLVGTEEEEGDSTAGTITVDLTLNAEPFKKKLADLLAGL